MSAIAGIIHFDGEPVARQDLERMGQALDAFGRDSQRFATGQGAGFVVRMAHITPEDRFDRQPLAMGDLAFFLFDGRLDNRTDLIRRLGLNDAASRVMADSALAAQAWGLWGRDSLNQMIGQFSVAHWQPANKTLTLGRSAPHGNSLYVHRKGSRLYFASAPHGLFALPQVPRRLNEAALGDLLLWNSGTGEFLFQDIQMVFQAHWVEYRVNGSESRRFWAPDPGRRVRFKREEEAWEEFHPLFQEVVKSHLRSIHPVGVQMSGGLDSAAIAGQAAVILARTGKLLQGYTRVPSPDSLLRTEGRYYNNERPRVELIAQMHPNLRPHFVHAGDEPVLERQGANFAAAYSTYGTNPTYSSGYEVLYRRAAGDGVRVLLNGGYGNVTFSYDGLARLRSLFQHGRWVALYLELSGLRRMRGGVEDIVRANLLQTPAFNALRMAWRWIRGRKNIPNALESMAMQEFAFRSGAYARRQTLGDDLSQWRRLDSWGQRAWIFSRPGQGMADFLQAGHGLEARSPGSDLRLVEFCLSMPDEIFLKAGIERRMIRLGLPHLIPEKIRLDFRRGRQDVDWAIRMRKDADAIGRRLIDLAADPIVNRYIDVGAMQDMWRQFEVIDWRVASVDQIRNIQTMMSAVTVGSFVRWFEHRN